ncbi:hypothetical protein GG344DRAFT_84039 [Lentinula edodes]|nr:hypothetical protein GG344DRAFT_84039 [Lentinula edodes]
MHGDVRKEQLIAPNVNARLVQFMTEQDLIYVECDGSPAVFNEDGLNWTVLYCQHSHRAGGSPILHHHPTPWQLNYWDLIQSAKHYSAVQVGESETELLVFLAPRNKIIAGFLPGQAPCVHRHLCLHLRLWAGFSSANKEDLVDIDNILREACWINQDGEITTGMPWQVAQLRGLSTQQINALTLKIREAIAFNTCPRQFQMAHPLVKAITEGINITLHHDTSSLYSTVFDSEPEQLQDYLISVWTGRHIQSWQDVVHLFDIQYIESAGREYLARERGFMAGLLRFLQKSVFNCRLFLVAVTGSPYVPVVVSGLPSRFHLMEHPPPSVAAQNSLPDNLEESTLFNSWLLALIGDGDFNNL